VGEAFRFVGTGRMGAPMVRRLLQAGLSVAVFDRDARALEPLVAAGA
jgi:3-hydroxyisobutyrate dehydrogenase-like beta-hydroxyacid dehydrogenase